MTDVLTVGETMMALRSTGPIRLGSGFTTSIAGAESNVAIGLARLGHAAAWAGRVGADEPGRLVTRTLRAEGVDVSGVRRDGSAPTGVIMFEQRLPTSRASSTCGRGPPGRGCARTTSPRSTPRSTPHRGSSTSPASPPR
ncbi:PfkB family carbohydrate kinase [Actinomadura sp. CNU-125]|uniref:PfkB family carbohydrate kinase n=1 Tax=Actinomadura sp. CNU-125 TaxID=1904961 RepID=UPI0021CCD9FB|nr:PfkB family carbohydrate kinase [Actinomadura sp. CNU-125]